MDNTEQLKGLIRKLFALLYKCCPANLAKEMFVLEKEAEQLGV